MNAAAIAELVLRLLLLLAGLLLPGTMVLRALRLPWSLAVAFAASAVAVYVVVLACTFIGVPLTPGTLAAGLAVTSLVIGLVPARGSVAALSPWHRAFTGLGGWTPLYALFWLIVGWRLCSQPLSGPDAAFRWSSLAEQMLQPGSLDFYPPRSGEDFRSHFWAESIPPGLPGLYAWAYAIGGSVHPLWTSPVVALQLLVLHELAWRLGSRWGGEVVARRAVILTAASPLLTWATLIGQETGLTTLAVCGLVWTLPHLRDGTGPRWALLAGLFAAIAGSAREYGPAFAVTALAASLFLAPRRATLVLAAVALPIALAWPVRTWLLTGNPFHSLDFVGLFPVNQEFIAWSTAFHAPHAHPIAAASGGLGLVRYLVLWALPAVIGLGVLLVLLVRGLRDARLPAVFVVLTVALWYTSLPYTAGGLFYSLRVLSPALALLPVLAAYGFTVWAAPIVAHVVTIGAALILAESLPKTLLLPENPYRVPWTEWPQASRRFADSVGTGDEALLAALRSLPLRGRIIADNAGYPRLLRRLDVEVVPLWSPDVAWLFDPDLPPLEIARRWQRAGFRHLVLGKTPSGADYVVKRARWRAPYFSVRTVAETEATVIIEAIATLPGSE
jgi:hypothetical protein